MLKGDFRYTNLLKNAPFQAPNLVLRVGPFQHHPGHKNWTSTRKLDLKEGRTAKAGGVSLKP